LQIPKVILRDYSQRPIPISAEVEIVIDWKGKQVTAPVYIRSDIGLQREPFLLGTNVVIPLGLMVPGNGVMPCEETENSKCVDGELDQVEPAASNSTEQCSENHDQSDSKMENTSGHATVKLVSSQRIPAKKVVILEGQIDCGSKFNTPVLFEPNHAIFNQTDLQVETALILPDDNNKVKVTVCNNFNKSQQLEADLDLGEVESCCSVCPLVYGTPIEVPIEDIDGKITSETVEMNAIYKVSSKDFRTAEVLNTDDRNDKLKRMLDVARGTM